MLNSWPQSGTHPLNWLRSGRWTNNFQLGNLFKSSETVSLFQILIRRSLWCWTVGRSLGTHLFTKQLSEGKSDNLTTRIVYHRPTGLVCVCETRYHIRNFDITVCYDNRDWVLQTTTFNSEMQGAGVWIRSLQPTKTLLMSQWYQPGTLGWRTCSVGSNFCTSCSITLFLSPLARIDWPNFTVCNRAPSKVT